MSAAVDPAVWGAPAGGIDALERELARFRRGRSAHAREHQRTIARAAVLNLVVVATREAHALRATRLVSRLALRHPARAVIVLSDRRPEDAPPGLSLHAQIPKVDQFEQVCYEQVLVRARGPAGDRIPSALIPLLLPDLPVFLWWTETPPIGQPHFERLLSLSERFIVDSADFARPERTLAALSAIAAAAGRARRSGLTDLNWARLTPWRELVTQLFDVPAWSALLPAVDGVRVGFSVEADGRQVHPSQALLLVGWLASRLGWTAMDPIAPSEAGGHLFAMRRPDGGTVRIRVRPRFERGLSEGDVSGVLIESALGGRHAEFRVRRRERQAVCSVAMDGDIVLQRVVPLPAPDLAELLGEELTIVAGDSVFEQALALLVTLE